MSLRDNFTLTFPPDRRTALWRCPRCSQGGLVLSEETMHLTETAESASYRDHDDWEPEWVTKRFIALAICDGCGEPVSISGTTYVEPDDDNSYWISVLRPLYVLPAPHIVPRPDSAPDTVTKLLAEAEELFWIDPKAGGNAIRCVLEAILTDRGVKRFTISKKTHKRQPLPLHARIVEFGKGKLNQSLAEKMLAVKWIGNSGSHDGDGPKQSDLFDGFDLLDHVLQEIYAKRTARLTSLAKRITKSKGPLSKHKKRRR